MLSPGCTGGQHAQKAPAGRVYCSHSLAAHLYCGPPLQVVAILEAGHQLPFSVEAVKLDLPELQASHMAALSSRPGLQ